MKFTSLENRGVKPKPLLRKPKDTRVGSYKPMVYNGVALCISIDNLLNRAEKTKDEPCAFCLKSEQLSANDPGCQKTFLNVHSEADTVAQTVLKRFDNFMIRLRNPSL